MNGFAEKDTGRNDENEDDGRVDDKKHIQTRNGTKYPWLLGVERH